MKKIFAAILISASLMTSCSKDDIASDAAARGSSSSSAVEDNIKVTNLPAAVSSAFNARFPGATNIEWKMKNGNYKVQFFLGTVRWEAIFTPTGTLVKQERA
jgi:major membrane immunogen (membrane-anchored lipoprotein)